ncbi:MAG: hypothetical protein IIB77_03925 [Proteobacteria bacterium]|nr:hypothetical protein [Pseudomonadota bacterium]
MCTKHVKAHAVAKVRLAAAAVVTRAGTMNFKRTFALLLFGLLTGPAVAGVLPEEEFRRFVIAPTKRIVESVKSMAPDVPVIGFPRGAGALLEAYVKETGVDAVGLDSSVSLTWAAATLQPVCTVQGNLDPVLLLSGGKPMQQAAHRILDALAGGPFIFNLGHGILPMTPPEHVADLFRCVRGWRA